MHMETMVLGIAFGTVVSVFRKIRTVQYKGRYSYVHYNELDNYNQLEEISSDSLITRKNEDFFSNTRHSNYILDYTCHAENI